MMESYGNQRCRTLCWVAAGLLGLFFMVLLIRYWDVRFVWALVFGLLSFFFLGWLIPLFACSMEDAEMPVRRMPAPVHPQPKPAPVPAATAGAAPIVTPGASVADKSLKPQTAKKAAFSTAPGSAKKAAKTAPAKVAKAKPTKAAETAVENVATASAISAKPAGLSAARDNKPDDLKVIVGIGPKMEILLNKLGFFHFDQIAAWKSAEVAWVDDNLEGFKGRVTRDKWVAQAKLQAKG